MQDERTEYHGIYVDGEFHNGVDSFRVENPSTGEPITTVAESGEAGIGDALKSANRAQPEWAAMDPTDHGQLLYRFAEVIADRAEELGEIVIWENGRPVGQSKGLADSAADYIEYYAG